jgi:hypothetical protein
MNNITKNDVLAFIIGASLPAPIYHSFVHGFMPKKLNHNISIEFIPLILSISFGITNIIYVKQMKDKDEKTQHLITVLTGIILGILASLYGRFIIKLPTKLFNIDLDDQWIVHILTPLFFTIIMYVIIKPLDEYFELYSKRED